MSNSQLSNNVFNSNFTTNQIRIFMKKTFTFLIRIAFILIFLNLNLSRAQCTVEHIANSATISTISLPSAITVGQSFIATCNGNLDYFEAIAGQAGIISGGTLNIYNGNTVSGTPIYSESYTSQTIPLANYPIRFNINGVVPLYINNQYTFTFQLDNVNLLVENIGSYSDGEFWYDGSSSINDMQFKAAINPSSYCTSHRPNVDTSNTLIGPTVETVGQSFVANCSGDMNYFEFTSNEAGTISAGTLNIYNGNTVTGTPAYTQPFDALNIPSQGSPIRLYITGTFPIISGNQYTITFTIDNVDFIYQFAGTYTDGNYWFNGTSLLTNDLSFRVTVTDHTLGTPSVNERQSNHLTLTPNPSSKHLSVKGLSKPCNYHIYNVIGKKISSGIIDANSFININHLENGIYFIQIENKLVLKFVKK